MNDEELEQLMRTGLHTKADEVGDHGGYAELAREGARTRRHTRVGLVAAATAAVLVGSAVVANQVAQDRETTPIAGPNPSPGATTASGEPSAPVPADWRVESYGGVQLYIPPDWGWGSAPKRDVEGGDGVYECGHGAFMRPGPDGQPVSKEDMDIPYVGRSRYWLTDVCGQVQPPTQPYVWFGAPIDVGTVELSNGFTQETIEVNDVRVTVGDDDPGEMATILGSVEAVEVDANGCAASNTVPKPSESLTAMTVRSVSVCAYRHGEDGSGVTLGYSTSIEGSAAQHVFNAIQEMPEVTLRCNPDSPPPLDDVLLRFHGDNGDVDVLARLDGCGGYYTGDTVRLLTRANVTPWVVDGVGLYVSEGSDGTVPNGIFHPIPG